MPGSQQRSDTSYYGPRNYHAPDAIPLLSVASNPEGISTAACNFRVPMPDARLIVKISVLFVWRGGTKPSSMITAPSSTIWLAGADRDTSGISGNWIRHTDVEGTEASPTSFPASSGLQGYSREFPGTSGDVILGAVSLSTPEATSGLWVLQTRFQPVAVSFPWNEWDEIRRECHPEREGMCKSI